MVAPPGLAQRTSDASTSTEADGNSGGIQEVIVTAERRSQNAQEVPIAITSITAAQLDGGSISDLRDLKMVAPALNVTAQTGHALPNLRGVGTALIGPGIENPVALYVDGVYYADATSALFTFNDIAQIDVLKGPQGTLFGRNATGGAIQITTLAPSHDFTAKGSVSYGNYATTVGKLYVSGGLADRLAGDVAMQYSHQGDGYGTNLLSGRDVNRTPDDYGARSKLRFESDIGTDVTLTGDYNNVTTSLGAAIHEAPGRKPVLGPAFSGGTYDITVLC
jgi:iron complex outermembrane receptor protein